MGATLGILSESRIPDEDGHAQFEKGLLDGGFVAISHNIDRPSRHRTSTCSVPADADPCSPESGGVVIAVRVDYVGGWTHTARGPFGRALAANLTSADGEVLRVLGLYGVTGACLSSFRLRPKALEVEQALNSFVLAQAALADLHGWILLAGGDLNSFTCSSLDSWGANYIAREQSLASTLDKLHLIETFRALHPDMRAFTRVHSPSTAARLDQIRICAPHGTIVQVLNAAIICNCPDRTDHDPIVTDFTYSLPTSAAVKQACDPPLWKSLLRRMRSSDTSALRKEVEVSIHAKRSQIESALAHLRDLHTAIRGTPDPSASGPDAGRVTGFPPSDAHTPDLGVSLSEAHESMRTCFLEALPRQTPPIGTRQVGRAISSWDQCLYVIHRMHNSLHSLLQLKGRRAPPQGMDLALTELQKLWEEGVHRLQQLSAQRTTARAQWSITYMDWDGFRSRPVQWATSIGFDVHTAMRLPLPATENEPLPSAAPYLEMKFAWNTPPIGENSARACLQQLAEWRRCAIGACDACRRLGSKGYQSSRLQSLHSHDLGTWLRMLRPHRHSDPSYCPEWYEADGHKARPVSPEQCLLGT